MDPRQIAGALRWSREVSVRNPGWDAPFFRGAGGQDLFDGLFGDGATALPSGPGAPARLAQLVRRPPPGRQLSLSVFDPIASLAGSHLGDAVVRARVRPRGASRPSRRS